MKQLDYNPLYHWLLGLGIDDAVWGTTTFTKDRNRLLEGDVAGAFFSTVVAQAEVQSLQPRKHFAVDGTLIEAWASQNRFRPRDEGAPPPDDEADFRGQRCSNKTHRSTSDPESRLTGTRRGKRAKPIARVSTSQSNSTLECSKNRFGGLSQDEAH